MADRLLANMKLQREGNDVRLQAVLKLEKTKLGALVSAIVAATQPPAASKSAGTKTKEPKTTKDAMRVHVVDQDGSPVAGTKVQAFASVKGHTTPIVWDYVCDANGQAVVDLPQSVIRLYLVLSKDGCLTLSRDYGLLTAGHQPPQDSTIKLVKLSPDQAKAIAEIEESSMAESALGKRQRPGSDGHDDGKDHRRRTRTSPPSTASG